MNKIALFNGSFRSCTGLLISLTTNCQFTHAAVQPEGEDWYHASEKLGRFDRLSIDNYAHRNCIIYEFDGDLSDWAEAMLNSRYDWRGVAGWAMHCLSAGKLSDSNPKKFYCFEAALSALYFARAKALADKRYSGQLDTALRDRFMVDPDIIKPVSGCDISGLFASGRYGLFGDVA